MSSQLSGLNRSGRKPGVPNKFSASIKEMVERALHKAGGVEYLARQAEQNPVAFMSLVGRVMPLQIAGHDGGKLQVEFSWKGETSQATHTINGNAVVVEADTDVDTPSITFIGEC